MLSKRKDVFFPLWDREPTQANTHTVGNIWRSRRRGASPRGDPPAKEKKPSLLSPVEICSVVFLQRAAEHCSGGIVTLQLLCMNNISCAIICVFLVAKLHTRAEKDEEGLQPWPQSHVLSVHTHTHTYTHTHGIVRQANESTWVRHRNLLKEPRRWRAGVICGRPWK